METKKRILFEIDKDICEKNYDQAIKTSKEGFKCFKDNCFLNKIVQIHQDTKNYKAAISVLKKMMKTEKDNEDLINRTAYFYFVSAKYKEALKYYKLLLDNNPISSKYNFNVACSYDFLKDYKNALKYYKLALDADSSNLSAMNNYAMVFYAIKQYDTAISILNRAISIAPSHPEAYHHMGVINREYIGDLEMSLLYLKKAFRLDSKYILNSYQVALTYKAMNDMTHAKEYVQKALKINPSYKPVIKLMKELEKVC